MAYLDRAEQAGAGRRARPAGACARERPTTFGWGPRFLHSTGQYHKGGPPIGVYLQVTGDPAQDLDVPGQPFSFGAPDRRPGSRRRAGARRPRPSGAASAPHRPRRWCRTTPGGPAVSPARVAAGQNPLRNPRDKRLQKIAGPCSLVIFGVTGDLARKKLMPAVYDLANRGLLPPGFSLVGFARRDWADQDFGQIVYDAVKQHARTPFRENVWKHLAEGFRFVPGDFDDDAAFDHLAEVVRSLDIERGTGGNHAFYLSIPPKFFSQVCEQLARSGLSTPETRHLAPGGHREAVRPRPGVGPRAERRGVHRSSRPTRCSGSTTTSARRRSRTSWRCASRTSCSSRSGTPTTSTTCRSPWPRTSASAAGPATTTASAPPATSSRTTCSSCSR